MDADVNLTPGFYQLTRDVENPSADRRKSRDWTAEPVFREGLVVYLRPKLQDTDWMAFERVGNRWSHQSFPLHHPAAHALASALEKIPEDLDCLLHRLGCHTDDLLVKLHQIGKLSLADIEDAKNRIDIDYEISDHKAGHHSDEDTTYERQRCPLCE
jgi:hypothetical protein